jgi:uncharacterized protein GlcG (DUF336 family)
MLTIMRRSRDDAEVLLPGARTASEDTGMRMCIAGAHESGNLILRERMDDTKISSIATAVGGAFTPASAHQGARVHNDAFGAQVAAEQFATARVA